MPAKSPLSVFCTLVLLLSISACEKPQEVASDEPVVRPVKLITVEAAGATQVNRFPAVIGANQLSELGMQVGGKLQEFPVKEAQSIERGSLIARLEQSDFESNVASAKAQFDNAEAEYERAVRLAEQDAIARSVLEQRKAQFDVARAQLDQAEKALSDSVLRAPFNGIIAETMVEELQTVSAGQTLIKLMSEDLFKATIDLPANFIARIPKQETENENRQILVFLDAAPNQPIAAEFKEATLIADTASQTYAVSFTFPPPNNLTVLPGMNATVELRRDTASESVRVAVPLGAVSSDGESNYVWKVDKQTMTVFKGKVSIEQGVGETVVVTAGLEANEVIAGAGAAYLSEGMKIREWEQ